MDAVLRNNSIARDQKYTVLDFEKEFPDDDACLQWLVEFLYPQGIHCAKCDRITKHHKVVSRKSYSCDHCGHHVHPTAGTIYHKSSTPLRIWFKAVHLMASSRCGISAKHLQREIGVTYKTAWRMFQQIRSMLNQEPEPLQGEVEVDETYVGGKRKGKRGRGAAGKTIVAGAVERHGRVIATTVPNVKAATLIPFVKQYVLPSAVVFTDELLSYNNLGKIGYTHKRVHHSAGIYVTGDATTNSIECFWSLFKRSIDGAHHSVSAKYLQRYLYEYSFRWNHRQFPAPMFSLFLAQVTSEQSKVANERIGA
jgi:transposase